MYSTTVSRLVAADRARVYAALLDPAAVARWRVPDGMTGEVHELDARVGGRIRMSLTYDDPAAAGKSGGGTDTYRGTYVELVPDQRVVEEVTFESDDPGLGGTITMTTTVRDADAGTEVEIRMDGVPDVVPPEQNELGTRMALDKLAGLVGSADWMGAVATIDLTADVVSLTRQLVDIESVSLHEQEIADAVETALRALGHLEVTRQGNNIVARTDLGRAERVVIAGHLDTVPLNDNLPSRLEERPGQGALLHGLGSCDMKGGDAVMLRIAATVPEPNRDLTFIFYEAEEIEAAHNGLRKLAEASPELLDADFAILMEPSNAGVEAGCQGTLRVDVRTTGERAHTARAWQGVNAIHRAGEVLRRLDGYQPRKPVIDGLEYHEGLNAVQVRGGVAGNVVPDECVIEVNYRFAPDLSEAEAEAVVREFFEGYDVTLTDSAPGALPGLDRPAAKAFLEVVGGEPAPKFGWTDVARFSAAGVPAVNFGPGDPLLAHKQEEHVPVADIERCEQVLAAWLTA